MGKLSAPLQRRLYSRVVLPIIIEASDGRLFELREIIRPFRFEVNILEKIRPSEISIYTPSILEIPTFNMLAAILPREVIEDLAFDPAIEKVYYDDIVYALQYPTVPREGVYVAERRVREKKRVTFTSTFWTKKLIGADVANKKGFTGKGILVSVLDTGSSATHEQLKGKLIHPVVSPYPLATLDLNGHGTWCASCIAGRRVDDVFLSKVAGRDVICEGVAPDATILPIKVLDFIIGMGSNSAIIKGVEMAIKHKANVLSLSLGGPVEAKKPEDDPHYKPFLKVIEMGAIPVVAAGNEGPGASTIGTPGALPHVLTVGATDPITGTVAKYSSRGPTPWGDIKPDCVAPGGGYPENGIDSAIVNLLDIAGDSAENRYSPIQGTSMATPHVSALIALMMQAYKTLLLKILTVNEIKRMLSSLGHKKTNDDGWGFIDWKMIELWLDTEYGVRI